MKPIIEKNNNELIILTKDTLINSSINNKEILNEVMQNLEESTNKIIIKSDYFSKEYDASILTELKKFKTNDPIRDYIKGRKELSNTKIISIARKFISKGMSAQDAYNKIFSPIIKPLFVKAELIKSPEWNLESSYKINNSIINILNNGTRFFYELKPFELNCDFESIKLITSTIKEIENMELDLTNLKEEVENFINKKITKQEIREIIKRHSIGFGILEILFNDPEVEDVYLYSSGGTVHLNHQEYGELDTNIIIKPREFESIATRIRAVSGRPFDDSFPVIDYDIKEHNLRVCGVREPLTFKGTGYAFRKHKNVPWTLNDFIENKMITSKVAGLINFLIDGQCSILVTGPRGSGKTSFLSALINEIQINKRIIIIEDTPELPIEALTKTGFKIQHLRIKPHLKKGTEYELSAEEALRTALRLGESVLVIGEVRGEEAKALFEAMRVGAAGDVVLGTIHGSTVFDTFDRVVNDLKVPATSFKATDIIISCANLRKGESLKTQRRVTSITEVKKDWTNNPLIEKGFNDLTIFNSKTKTITLSPRISKSTTLTKIAKLKGMSINECINSINLRAKAKELTIKTKIPKEAGINARINSKITELLSKNKKRFITEFKKYLETEKKEFLKVPLTKKAIKTKKRK